MKYPKCYIVVSVMLKMNKPTVTEQSNRFTDIPFTGDVRRLEDVSTIKRVLDESESPYVSGSLFDQPCLFKWTPLPDRSPVISFAYTKETDENPETLQWRILEDVSGVNGELSRLIRKHDPKILDRLNRESMAEIFRGMSATVEKTEAVPAGNTAERILSALTGLGTITGITISNEDEQTRKDKICLKYVIQDVLIDSEMKVLLAINKALRAKNIVDGTNKTATFELLGEEAKKILSDLFDITNIYVGENQIFQVVSQISHILSEIQPFEKAFIQIKVEGGESELGNHCYVVDITYQN